MQTTIEKITRAEQARLRRLRAQADKRVRQALDTFLTQTRSDAMLRRVIKLLESNSIDEVLALVASHVLELGAVIPEIYNTIATAETKAAAEKARRAIPEVAGVGIAFDPTHPRAAEAMARARLDMVTDFTDKQRAATRKALTDALRSGEGPRRAARAYRDSIGLTESQLAAVDNYRKMLVTLNSDALQRDVRDRRFDNTIRTAIANNEPLSQAQIDKMVDRYHSRYVQYRSEVIARTETTRALGEARREAELQTLEQLELGEDDVERIWHTNIDGRERDSHAGMDGQTVQGMSTPFITPSGVPLMYPGDPAGPAEEVIQCRCYEEVRIKPPSERARRG